MGPHETEQPGMLYYDSGGGFEPFMPIKNIQNVPEIVIDGDNIPYDETYTAGPLHSVEIAGHLTPRRMSRKRFVKLLMANGVSRNDAVVEAGYYRFKCMPYWNAWFHWIVTGTLLSSNLTWPSVRKFMERMRPAK